MAPAPTTRSRATRHLTIAQAAAFAVSGVAFAVGPVAVIQVSGEHGLAGLMLALLTLSGGLGSWVAGRAMDRFGHTVPLAAAHATAGAAGAVAGTAVAVGSPVLLLAAAVPLGAGQGAALMGRVTVAGMYRPDERAGVTGRLVLVGAAGAITGPLAAGAAAVLVPVTGGHPLAVAWLAVPALAAVGAVAVVTARIDRAPAAGADAAPRRAVPDVSGRLAALGLAGAQSTMAGLMALAPVAVHHHTGSDTAATLVVAVHLAGMYGAAPLVGRLADRAGHRAALLAGGALSSGAAALAAAAHVPVVAAVALGAAGVGWSAAYLVCAAVLGSRRSGPAGAVGGSDLGAAATGAGTALATGAAMGSLALPVIAVALAVPALTVAVAAGAAHARAARDALGPAARAPQPA